MLLLSCKKIGGGARFLDAWGSISFGAGPDLRKQFNLQDNIANSQARNLKECWQQHPNAHQIHVRSRVASVGNPVYST
jgi:hypothetical protein